MHLAYKEAKIHAHMGSTVNFSSLNKEEKKKEKKKERKKPLEKRLSRKEREKKEYTPTIQNISTTIDKFMTKCATFASSTANIK